MKQYLTFSSDDLNFGLESIHVREIFPLPELQIIAEAPGDVIGLLNLRGRLTPIIHLAKRLGVGQPSCRLQDSVIVLDWQGLQVGLVVSQVHEVKNIADEAIADTPDLERDQYVNTALVHGYAQLEDDLLTILHPDSLIRQAADVAVLAWEAELNQTEGDSQDADNDLQDNIEASFYQSFYDFCNGVTAADRQVFARRAQDLRAPLESYDISNLEPITIISIGGESFGVALDSVREFIHVPKLTQVPCAPRHIIGNFNLRGEIITLLDLSTALELPDSNRRPKAVILEVDRQRVGVSVDEVYDVLYLAQEDYLSFPATVSPEHQKFLTGAFEYQGQVVQIINLLALLNLFQPQAALAA